MTDQNARFLVHLKGVGQDPAGYRVAHIHVSQIPPAKKTRDNLSRAIGIFADLKYRYKDGDIFLMKNFDIVFISRNIGKPVIATACEAIQQVFLGQLGATFTNVHGGVNEFFTLFNLTTDYQDVLKWAEDAAGVARATRDGDQAQKASIDVSVLVKIKEEIHKIDTLPILFNQPVYSIVDRKKPIPTFHEMYISIPVLEDIFCPGQSLTSRKGLFTDLTEELDIVVLGILAEPPIERGRRRRMSINVNLATLASPTFVGFDAELPPDARQGVVLEINKTDVFENMRLYRELVPFLRDRGYKILLDGLSFYNVAAIDFAGIDCDFAKIFWSEEAASLDEEITRRVLDKVKGCENPLFLLGRCDTAESIRFARTARIQLVQGRLVDHMVKKQIPF